MNKKSIIISVIVLVIIFVGLAGYSMLMKKSTIVQQSKCLPEKENLETITGLQQALIGSGYEWYPEPRGSYIDGKQLYQSFLWEGVVLYNDKDGIPSVNSWFLTPTAWVEGKYFTDGPYLRIVHTGKVSEEGHLFSISTYKISFPIEETLVMHNLENGRETRFSLYAPQPSIRR